MRLVVEQTCTQTSRILWPNGANQLKKLMEKNENEISLPDVSVVGSVSALAAGIVWHETRDKRKEEKRKGVAP